MDIIDKIKNKSDIYSIALLLLYAMSDIPEYSMLSELVYLLDHDSFINLMKYYEGQTIKIPTKEEIQESLRLLVLYGCICIDNQSWWEAIEKAGISREDSRKMKYKFNKFIKKIEENNYKIGGILKDEQENN